MLPFLLWIKGSCVRQNSGKDQKKKQYRKRRENKAELYKGRDTVAKYNVPGKVLLSSNFISEIQ